MMDGYYMCALGETGFDEFGYDEYWKPQKQYIEMISANVRGGYFSAFIGTFRIYKIFEAIAAGESRKS